MTPPEGPLKPGQGSDEIIEDLQNIKSLLLEADDEETLSALDEVPILEDSIMEPEDEVGLGEQAIKSLLDDAWQDSVDDVLRDARGQIENNSTAWLPSDTEQLTHALKARIDDVVKDWLAVSLRDNIELLRKQIINELSKEVMSTLEARLKQPNTPTSEPQGKR